MRRIAGGRFPSPAPMRDTGTMDNEPAIDRPTPAAAPSRDLGPWMDHVRAAPRDAAAVELIVRRPGPGERETVLEALLDPELGLVGDGWLGRGSRAMADGGANPEAQLTIMGTRVLEAIEPDRGRWPLAGDQLFLDLDLGEANLPTGTRLAIGTAIAEVTALPHTGCSQFAARFGHDALRWISTPEGRSLRMRGMYVRVVRAGTVRVGDRVARA